MDHRANGRRRDAQTAAWTELGSGRKCQSGGGRRLGDPARTDDRNGRSGVGHEGIMGEQVGEAASLADCGRATRRGLRLRAGLTFEDWVRAGRKISKISSASAWWLGDWLVYGERAYGKRYRAALELTSLDYKTLRNYAWVARRFELSRRRDNLSFQHHVEVAALPEAEQELWLTRAEKLRWSRNELRRNLAAGRSARHAGSLDRPVVVRIEVQADRERRWRQAADASHQSLAEWIAAAADHVARAVDPSGSRTTSLPAAPGAGSDVITVRRPDMARAPAGVR